jgi:hypothetical protein
VNHLPQTFGRAINNEVDVFFGCDLLGNLVVQPSARIAPW